MSMLVIVFAALVGCGGEAADQGAAGTPGEAPHGEAAAHGEAAPTEAAPAEAAPAEAAPAGAALTKAQLDEAAALAVPMQPWGEAEAAIKAKLGDAQKTEGDVMTWVAKDGESCAALTVKKMGDTVDSATVAAAPCI